MVKTKNIEQKLLRRLLEGVSAQTLAREFGLPAESVFALLRSAVRDLHGGARPEAGAGHAGDRLDEFFGLWAERRGSHAVPAFAEFTLRDLAAWLPNLAIVEAVGSPPRLKVRVAGRRIHDCLDVAVDGRFLDEVMPPALQDHVTLPMLHCLAEQAPVRAVFAPAPGYLADCRIHSLLLPCAGDGATAGIVLAAVQVENIETNPHILTSFRAWCRHLRLAAWGRSAEERMAVVGLYSARAARRLTHIALSRTQAAERARSALVNYGLAAPDEPPRIFGWRIQHMSDQEISAILHRRHRDDGSGVDSAPPAAA